MRLIASDSVWWRSLRALLLFTTVCLALVHALGFAQLRFISELDLSIADARVRALMPLTRDSRIVIVDIDEKSLAEIGHWPWGRNRIAALVDELFVRQGVAVLGFDVLFAETDTTSGLAVLERVARQSAEVAAVLPALRSQLDFDALLAQSLKDRNVVLGYYLTNQRDARQTGTLPAPLFAVPATQLTALTRWDGYAANLAPLAQVAPRAGYFNNVPDSDGLVRSVPLISEFNRQYFECLALAMFRVYTGHPAVTPVWTTEKPWLGSSQRAVHGVMLRQGASEQAIPVDARGNVRVPFRGLGGPRGGSFEYVSATDLLNNRIAAGHLAGKLVLLGSSTPGLYDQRATPVADVYPGVEVHANLLSGLLDDRFAAQPDWAVGFDLLQLLLIAGLLIGVLPRLRAIRAAQAVVLLMMLLTAINFWAASAYGLLLPLALALVLTTVLYVGISIWGYIIEGRSRRSLARLFGTYVPPELVTEMAKDPAHYSMQAQNRVLTVMFCDMRNFTQVSELLPPHSVRALMNTFFSAMTLPLRQNRGTLDKYIGDAIMAFWGAPLQDETHAANAVRTALAMLVRLKTLNMELKTRNLPEIGLSIGLNTGLVCVGDMGSNIRRSYTVMGDPVNLSSRIEGLTRHYGLDLLITQATRDEIERTTPDHGWYWLEVDRVRVKGKRHCVTLFTVLNTNDANFAALSDETQHWHLALSAYRLQHWDQARIILNRLLGASVSPNLLPLYQHFSERVEHYRSTPPPPNWDGAHTFENK
jgi:adenylate cyclase